MRPSWFHESVPEGPFIGLVGLGQAEPTPGGPPHMCDFTQEPFVSAIQKGLGVPATGKWDEATCSAWFARYGHAPTGAELSAAFPDEACGWLVLPDCPEAPKATLGKMILWGAGGGLALALLTVLLRRR